MHDSDVVAFEIRRPWPSGKGYNGKRYWPALITVWHREPGGHDSGEVCFRTQWKWHVHHWRIQIPSFRNARRWLLTRCEWCGGKSRKGDRVNCAASWGTPRAHWWQGERGLFHGDCSTARAAHMTCTCADPLTNHDGWGECAFCGRSRGWGSDPERLARLEEIRESTPVGTRPDLSESRRG